MRITDRKPLRRPEYDYTATGKYFYLSGRKPLVLLFSYMGTAPIQSSVSALVSADSSFAKGAFSLYRYKYASSIERKAPFERGWHLRSK